MKVYCVYGYTPLGCDFHVVQKIFRTEAAAIKYMNEENKKEGWTRFTCVDEMKVED